MPDSRTIIISTPDADDTVQHEWVNISSSLLWPSPHILCPTQSHTEKPQAYRVKLFLTSRAIFRPRGIPSQVCQDVGEGGEVSGRRGVAEHPMCLCE